MSCLSGLLQKKKGVGKQMIKSMTGFGRCEVCEADYRITVEMKSINHRYLDLNLKMPRKLGPFEAAVRSLLKGYVQRGKLDVYVNCEDLAQRNVAVRYNRGAALEYLRYLKQMQEEFGLENDVKLSVLSRYPEVFSMEETQPDEEGLWKVFEKALQGALQELSAARVAEGANLQKDLLEKLSGMLLHVAFIEERSPQIVAEYRAKLEERVRELLDGVQPDEGRLLTEVTVYADKVCVDEEIVRLKSHIEAMKKELLSGKSVGRKLDFLAQEMNREANTILSKTTDLELSNRGIDLKTEIEKVREQIQNIE